MGPIFDLEGELERVEEIVQAKNMEKMEKETAASTQFDELD